MKRCLMALAIMLSSLAVAQACSIPVFRFALERWRPDPYRVTLFHRGPLAETDRALLDLLETQQNDFVVNLQVRTVDVTEFKHGPDLKDAPDVKKSPDGPDGKDAEARKDDQQLYASLGEPEAPVVVVRYPTHLQIPVPVWSGPFSRDAVDRLTGSPLRREIVRRLVDGQTAVWLLLECGQPEKDKAAAKLVEEQLKALEQKLKLPELAPQDNLLASAPLKLAFSVLRVPRGDAEQPLVQMLLHSEPDLPELSDQPMVFPVFGRGRALLPLVGAGITEDNVHSSATFLVGSCSCEVKELNPGFDLLLSADWDQLLATDGVALTPPSGSSTVSGGAGKTPPGEPELVPIPSGASPAPAAAATVSPQLASPQSASPPAAPPARQISLSLIVVAAAGMAIVIGLVVGQLRGRNSPQGSSGPHG